jgi:arsenate reductase-like glutaredoxin family protein
MPPAEPRLFNKAYSTFEQNGILSFKRILVYQTKQMTTNTLLRIAALKDPAVKAIVPLLGRLMNATNAKAIRQLDWSPRSTEEAVLATAESLIRLHLLDQ